MSVHCRRLLATSLIFALWGAVGFAANSLVLTSEHEDVTIYGISVCGSCSALASTPSNHPAMEKFVERLLLETLDVRSNIILIADEDGENKPESERRVCEPNFDIKFSRERLCLTGFPEHRRAYLYESAEAGRREVQWNARNVLARDDELSAAWPVGVSAIRISDGDIAPPRVPLMPSEFPNMLMADSGFRPTFFPQILTFGDGGLRINCLPTSLPAAQDKYVEACSIAASLNGLRITVYVYTGTFWDGSLGWPVFLRGYEEEAWQASLEQVQQFLNLAIIFRERL